tara:strand:- start:11246 stop:12280 length:1035 start_codon:yes stop_codon:yes gene_type:complete
MSVFQSKNDLLFNITNPHNLIPKNESISIKREMNYFSFNSIYRDKRLYPDANSFTSRLPVTLSNIISLSLFSIFFTGPIYNFSENLGNNSFKIGKYNVANPIVEDIRLVDGNYTIYSIIDYINQILSERSLNISINYLKSQNRFVFFSNNTDDNRFYIEVDSESSNCNNSNTLKDLLYTLGFDVNRNYNRIDSINTDNIKEKVFLFERNLTNITDWSTGTSGRFYAMAQSQPRFRSEEPIFLEIEKYNVNISESRDIESDYGSVFSAFAKIDSIDYNSSNLVRFTSGKLNGIVDNVTKDFPMPVNHVSNLKFKFRYGDNVLVDLQNTSIDFTIAITILDEKLNK